MTIEEYHAQTGAKNKIFWLCVAFLVWLAKKTGTTYENVNVIIFCILLPIILFGSLGLNVYFMFF